MYPNGSLQFTANSKGSRGNVAKPTASRDLVVDASRDFVKDTRDCSCLPQNSKCQI